MNWNDLLWIGLIILFVVIPAIGRFLSKFAQQGRNQPGQRPGVPQPPGPQPRPAQRPRAGGLENEITEFLRRAAQNRGRGPRQQAGPPQMPRPQPAQAPVQAELVEPERPAVGEGLKERVKMDMDTATFQKRGGELGQGAARAKTETKQRLTKRFQHRLGQLEGTLGQSARRTQVEEDQSPEDQITPFPATSAAGLAVLLSDAQSLRQAIVLNEILQRPEYRW